MNDGGPAFPRPVSASPEWEAPPQMGMSLRDYFAAKAMQGMIQAGELDPLLSNMPDVRSACVKESWKFADAMLKARESKP